MSPLPPRVRPGQRPSAFRHNMLIDAHESAFVAAAPGMRAARLPGGVMHRPVGRIPFVRPSTFLSKAAFGWASESGLEATINGGFVLGFTGLVEAAGRAVTCGGNATDRHLIVATGGISPLSGQIAANSIAKSSFSGHGDTEWMWPLYEVYIDNGTVRMFRCHHIGVINLKSWVAP